jgi:hypothetical protein
MQFGRVELTGSIEMRGATNVTRRKNARARSGTNRSTGQKRSPWQTGDRIFGALTNADRSRPFMKDMFGRLQSIMELIGYGLRLATDNSDPRNMFANDLAALSSLIRAYHGIQAGANLAILGFPNECRIIMRSNYESAGLARMLAHNAERAEKWMRKLEWVPDKIAREFAVDMAGGDETARLPHDEFYKHFSAATHPSAITTLPYLLSPGGEFEPRLEPKFDQGSLHVAADELTAQALFVAYCFRNSLADQDVMPPGWHAELARHAREFSGMELEHLDFDWISRERRHNSFVSQIRPIEEIDGFLRAHPNSVHSQRIRMGEKSSDE